MCGDACELIWPVEISTGFQMPLTVPLYSSDGRLMPAVREVEDWERVLLISYLTMPDKAKGYRFVNNLT